MNLEGRFQLCIYRSGNLLRAHRCDAYWPDQGSGRVRGDHNQLSNTFVEEHGWFQRRVLFDQICQTQSFPNSLDEEQVFKAWRSAVLSTIEGQAHLWVSTKVKSEEHGT